MFQSSGGTHPSYAASASVLPFGLTLPKFTFDQFSFVQDGPLAASRLQIHVMKVFVTIIMISQRCPKVIIIVLLNDIKCIYIYIYVIDCCVLYCPWSNAINSRQENALILLVAVKALGGVLG